MVWNKWQPTPTIKGKYEIENMEGNLEKLEIKLKRLDSLHSLSLQFQFVLIAFQSTAIELRKKTLQTLSFQLNTSHLEWTFFQVLDSPYSAWLSQQSCGIHSPADFTHHVIITPSLVVDIALWGVASGPIIEEELGYLK